MVRVLKPGGVLGISDMSAPREAIRDLNEIEALRDPSHVRARTPDEWLALVLGAGLRLEVAEVTVEPMSLQEWLAPVRADEPGGRAALRRIHAFDETTKTLIAPDGGFLKYRILVVGQKPVSA